MCLNNSYQTVCGASIEYYRQAGPRSGVSWCILVRAQILHAIVANQCLPPCVDHPNFEERFMPSVRIACNMVHGDDFASVIGPRFDRLVKHYVKRWVVANGIVLVDKSVTDGYRFNQELVGRCFHNVGAIERWLRDDMGKLDWWEKVARDPGLISPPTPVPSTAVATPNRSTPATPTTPTTPATPLTQSQRRGTAMSRRRLPQTPTYHKGGPDLAEMDRLVSGLEALGSPSNPGVSQTPSTPTRCPPGPPSGLFSDLASGSTKGEDPTPVLGLDTWAPTLRAAVPDLKTTEVMFPAKDPSTVPPSAERSIFPSSSSSSSSPAPRHLPAPSTITSSYQGRSITDATTSTFMSSVAPPSSPPSSRFQESLRPLPNSHSCSGGDGGDDVGVESGVEAVEDRIRESLELTRRAWRYVVEVEAAAQVLMFSIDKTV